MRSAVIWAAMPVLAAAGPAGAQSPSNMLDPVVITGQRVRESAFNVPGAITAVTREVIDAGGPQVNLSEALNRVPGLTVLNRQNYAQDLQVSSRGFGARATFGVRGVRLLQDGIPRRDGDLNGLTVTTLPLDTARPNNGQGGLQLNLFLYRTTPNPGWRNVELPSRSSDGSRRPWSTISSSRRSIAWRRSTAAASGT